MFFFARTKKKCAAPSLRWSDLLSTIALLGFVVGSNVSLSAIEDGDYASSESWSDYVPLSWQEDIVMPIITSSLVTISKDPLPGGHSNVVIRYTIKNDSTAMDTLGCVQISLDLANQIGVPPYVALTGSLTAMTGSGNVFGLPIPVGNAVFEGMLNPLYDGVTNDTLFTGKPSLAPGQCIAVDIPFELRDTTSTDPIILNALASGLPLNGGATITQVSPPLTLIAACESESLACAGKVNVSIGPDCMAIIGVNTVFLNQVVDPNRYSVVVYDGDVLLGDTLDESHVGKTLTYSVLDGCFGGRASCWGEINLENKNLPRASSTFQQIYCGEDPGTLASLEEIIESIEEGECFVALSNYQEIYTSDVDKCDGGLIRRVVTADYEIDGWKVRDTVHVDSILELPLDTSIIEMPKGPEVDDAIYVDCDSLDGGYPTPEFIKDYFNSLPGSTGSGVMYAYPYIDRGTITMEMYSTRDSIIEIITRDTLTIDGLPVLVNVVTKDTITFTDTTFIMKPYLVPVKTGTTCNLTTNYSDEYFPGCVGPETKIKRTWSLLNWCTGQLTEFDQWIVIQDNRGPDIDMPDTLSLGVLPWACNAEYQLEATVTDNCSEVRNLNWKSTAGVIDSNNVLKDIVLSDSPVYVTLQAIDDCGNDSTKTLVIYLIDSIAPVAIAKDQINTSITYDPVEEIGIAKVTATSIDAGSHDSDCGPITICVLLDEELKNPIRDEFGNQVRDSLGNLIYVATQCFADGVYEDIPYVICREAVKFCCDQVGEHSVALLAHDRSPYSPPGVSWTLVNVEDKSFPIIRCEDVAVSCGDDLSPDSLGYPDVSNGFCDNTTLTYEDDEDLGDCGEGVIDRYWLANGDTACVQRITIGRSEAFDPTSIKWPKHYDNERYTGVIRTCVADTIRETTGEIEMGDSFICGQDLLDEPVWCSTKCSLLFMSFEDNEVEASEACKKIIRTWTIIDWCNYEPNSNDAEEDNDTFEAVSDEDIDSPNTLAELRDGDLCATCSKPSSDKAGDIFFRYTDVDVDGFYTYKQVIKVVDDTPPVVDAPASVDVEITGGATTKGDDFEGCNGEIVVSALAIDLCGDILLDASTVRWEIEVIDEDSMILNTKVAFGDSVTMKAVGMANTQQFINWYIADGCGNEANGQTVVNFNDVINPVPLCISDLSIATMNDTDGTATIWASDYDHGSFDNCSDVKFFFVNEEGFSTSSLIFTCADIPDGRSTVKYVELHVADEAGNESICNISIQIDDNNNICVDSAVGAAAISGQVMTALGDMIEAARVSLNGRDNQTTDVTGAYAFADVPMASSYKIEGKKNTDPLNGVSTLDLLLIQKHILGRRVFDSPYKLLAADINSDTRISAIDLVHLRRLILGQTVTFPNNESWRFVDPNQEFANPQSPWPFANEVVIYNLSQDMDDQNLLGVKIGDVNGNAIANSLLAGNRSSASLELSIDDVLLKKGETIDVPIHLNSAEILTALQFTLDTRKVRVEGVYPGSLVINDHQYALHDDGTLTMAWHDIDGQEVRDDLFSVRVTPLEDILISEAFIFTDRITPAIGYTVSTDPMTLKIRYEGDEDESIVASQFALLQNEPNPFSNTTKIGFVIPQDGDVRLSITDISGRTIHRQQGFYKSGYNEIIIMKEEVQARGVVYYQLETSGHTETKKMIIID